MANPTTFIAWDNVPKATGYEVAATVGGDMNVPGTIADFQQEETDARLRLNTLLGIQSGQFAIQVRAKYGQFVTAWSAPLIVDYTATVPGAPVNLREE